MKLSKSVYLLLVIGLLGALLAPPVTAQGTDIPFTGLIQSVDGALLRVNGLIVDVSGVTLETTLEAGMTVTVTGQLQENGSVVAQSLIVVTAPPAGTEGDGSEGALPVSGGGDICPLGQGFWKNHAEAWPVQELTLGSQTYSQEELLDLLRMPVGGDASLSLAHQLIAAKLSIAYGTDDSLIESFISGADEALAGFEGKLPYGVAPSGDRDQRQHHHDLQHQHRGQRG
jgi:hypothetical protein